MDEACFSGYCRQIDQARTVFCEFDASPRRLVESDCSFPNCDYAPECPIAQAFLEGCVNTGREAL